MAIGETIRAKRRALNLTQIELARRTGLSRQALGAIESGVYQPGVGAALSLARELGETVERLFGVEDEKEGRHLDARWYDDIADSKSSRRPRASLGRVGGRIVAVPQDTAGLSLSPVAGIVAQRKGNHAEVVTYNSSDEIDAALLIAGCDPSVTLLADWMTRHHSPARLVPIPCSSSRALDALVKGCAHTAGVHLRDADAEDYNLESVSRALGRRAAIVVTFARWEAGLAVRAGNPLGIATIADLAKPRLQIANREPGSGARAVLDAGLKQAGIRPDRIAGYQSEYGGHLEVANAIASGQADTGVTLRVAADAYDLEFIRLREERYDLVILAAEAETPPVKAMLDSLSSRRFAREISQFCGYDTEPMGRVVARLNMEAPADD
jgi:molybdate-binding protein/transcriptional regulator with XRE-family HTH domain